MGWGWEGTDDKSVKGAPAAGWEIDSEMGVGGVKAG